MALKTFFTISNFDSYRSSIFFLFIIMMNYKTPGLELSFNWDSWFNLLLLDRWDGVLY